MSTEIAGYASCDQGIPPLIFFRDGAGKGRGTGAVPKGQIAAAIARFFG